MSQAMKTQKQFEDRIYTTVQTILGEACPSLDVLRKPTLTSTGRGRSYRTRFDGLNTPQCEEIKLHARREEVTRLEGFGLVLAAYHHRDCCLGVFAGDFSLYAKCYLHQHFAVDRQSAGEVAKLYGLEPDVVAAASRVYRAWWSANTRDWLIRSFAKGTAGTKVEKACATLDRLEAAARAN